MENLHRFESECAPAASPRGANRSGKRRRAGLLAVASAVAVLVAGGALANDGLHLGLDGDGDPVRATPMGVSGGNINHFDADGACHNGTLGALVEDGSGNRYILSNNHVLARINLADDPEVDGSVPSGINPSNPPAELIIQPGLVDQVEVNKEGDVINCIEDEDDAVAALSAFVPIDFNCQRFAGKRLYICYSTNYVDAALARIYPGEVSSEITDIGAVCPEFYQSTYSLGENSEVTVGMPGCKSGRTTGLTCSKVSAIDVVVAVLYCADCEDPPVARFDYQIMIKGGDFAGAGDSGSFVVNQTDRKAVGLLFAGSSKGIIANPFDAVSDAFGGLTPVGPVGDECVKPIAVPESGGGGNGNKGKGQGGGKPSGAGMAVGLEVARDVKRRHEDELFGFPGVVGTGIGADKAGNPVIEVYLAVGGSVGFGGPQLPDELEGVSVRPVVTGPFIAY
jgi:hypothetical protein